MKNGKPVSLKTRLERLEADVKEIKAALLAQQEPKKPWWDEMTGVFANDPVYAEIIQLGLEVREKERRKFRQKLAKTKK